jgi:hypothetical protein
MYEVMRRLHPRGTASTGITVDPVGAILGPDCILVRSTTEGYRCISRGEAAALQEFLFADGAEPDWLFGQCCRIAKALDRQEIALAQIFGLRIPVEDLDSDLIVYLPGHGTFAIEVKTGENPPLRQPNDGFIR